MEPTEKKTILQKVFKVFDVDKPEESEDFALFMENLDFALSTLDERELCVLNGRCKGKTLAELSKTILRVEGNDPKSGINRERVRQIEKKATKKMRHPLRLLILKGKVRTPEEYERLKKLKHEELLQMLH
jgi:DNA-directed RNA polymerase sigma subunit (sigma70/sigma32)